MAQLGSGDPVNLTKDSPANDCLPSWSHDGREIAFASDRGGEWAIWVVPAIGGNPRKVLPLPGIGPRIFSAPQWSNDGSKLFMSVPHGSDNVVFVLSLESLESTRVVLPSHDGMVCHDLSVRPDGRRFAYVDGGPGGSRMPHTALDCSGIRGRSGSSYRRAQQCQKPDVVEQDQDAGCSTCPTAWGVWTSGNKR